MRLADVLPVLVQGSRLWVAGAVTVVFALLARLLRGVTTPGAITGAAVCFVLYTGAGRGAFAALVAVFVLTWLTTRLGYRRKQKLRTAQSPEGRSASQVLANLSVAATCAGASLLGAKPILVLAACAALSEAAADTVSSEFGQARSEKARLITNWAEVPAGTNGGVSWEGTLAGLVAAAVVSVVGSIAGLLPPRWLGVSIASAFAGMIADSFLGAALERRGFLNNNWVNFFGTMVAAAIATLLVR